MQQAKWTKSFSANNVSVDIEFTCLYKDKRPVEQPKVDPVQFGRQFSVFCMKFDHFEIAQAMSEVVVQINEYMKVAAFDDAECALLEAA
jgi:hypothetical protein